MFRTSLKFQLNFMWLEVHYSDIQNRSRNTLNTKTIPRAALPLIIKHLVSILYLVSIVITGLVQFCNIFLNFVPSLNTFLVNNQWKQKAKLWKHIVSPRTIVFIGFKEKVFRTLHRRESNESTSCWTFYSNVHCGKNFSSIQKG